MVQIGQQYGTSTRTGPFGMTESQFDPGAAMQQRLAQEQWNWQKKLYGQQQKLGEQAATGLSGMIGQYNTAYEEAKAANEQRYQAMLGITDTTTGQRAADIRSSYGEQGAQQQQQLARLGMSGTTIAPTMQMGVQREQQSALNRLADQMQGTKLGIMERRTDEYPKSDIIMSLVQALSQGGGGAGAGSIFNALSQMKVG